MSNLSAARVQENSIVTGTGSITLAGATTPAMNTFASAFADGTLCGYIVLNLAVQTEWEQGIGTYAAGANTITRTYVTNGSNGTQPVNFSAGDKLVLSVAPPATVGAAWSTAAVYAPGDTVQSAGALWYALNVNVGSEPSATNSNWAAMGGGGGGIQIDNRVNTYGDLSGLVTSVPLGTGNTGYTVLNSGDGLLYVWDGSAFPADGNGVAFQGPKGDKGDTGNTGTSGTPGAAATVAVGTTTTLAAGASATANNSGTSSAAIIDFGIPQGIKGDSGGGLLDGGLATLLTNGTGVVPTKAYTFVKATIGGTTLFLPAYRVVAITTASPLSIPFGATGSKALTASGGQPPYAWSADTLPAGITLATDGTLNYDGTQADGGTAIAFTVTDVAGNTATSNLTLRVAAATSVRAWRIQITAVQSGKTTDIAQAGELAFRATIGGASLCTGGTPFADSVIANDGNGPYTADQAFDGSASTVWSSTSSTLPHFIGYILSSASPVKQVMYQARNNGSWSTVVQWVPRDFTIQSSADSTTGLDGTWVDEWSVTGQTGWSAGEVRTFTRP